MSLRCKHIDCLDICIQRGKYCKKHGGGKRCQEPECDSSARGKTNFCITHGGGKRCPNCVGWPDSYSGNKNYDWYCSRCFQQLYPDDSRTTKIRTKSKEILVRDAINDHFEEFIHDKPLYTGNCDCTHRRRIDHRRLIGNTFLAIETDEFGHRYYDKKDEEIRYDDVYMIHSGKWVFIRFNPDKNGTTLDYKLEQLIMEIHYQINRIQSDENVELVEIIKLFF